MSKEISLVDIINYLHSLHLQWTGEIFDYSIQRFRKVKSEDIVNNDKLLLKLKDDYIYFDLTKYSLEFTYSPDDIATFIAENFKYYWDTHIIDNNYKSRPATAQDFIPHFIHSDLTRKVSLPVMDIAKNNKSKSMEVIITNSKFLVETYEDIHSTPYFDSYSEVWQKFLLHRYPEKYAPILIDILMEECRKIEERATIKRTLFGKKKVYSAYDASTLERNRKRLAETMRLFDDNYSV